MNTSVKCAVCGNDSFHKFNGSANAFGELDLDTYPDKVEPSTLPHFIQRCPHCGYCNTKITELIDSAKEQIEFDEYRAQLNNEKFPEIANSFLCAGLLHEYAEKYVMAEWDCLCAAKVCDVIENNKAATYCRRRALAMFEEATDLDQTNGAGQSYLPNSIIQTMGS